MNLVGNSCVSAFIMRDCLKKEFNNPFCWAIIDFDSMYNLIGKLEKTITRDTEGKITHKNTLYLSGIIQ